MVTATDVPSLTKISDVNWDAIDAAFCCLPHATTQEIVASLPKHIKVVDLSADFRLRDVNTYAEWWGKLADLFAASAHKSRRLSCLLSWWIPTCSECVVCPLQHCWCEIIHCIRYAVPHAVQGHEA